MGEMSDSITGVPQSGKQLYDCITYHKKLGFNRYGKRKNKQAFIRKRHAESQQNSIDCTRGADSGPTIQIVAHGNHGIADINRIVHSQALPQILYILHSFLNQTGTQAAHDIIKQEATTAPIRLHHPTEHPHGEHIKKDMRDATVHEHIRKELVEVEIGS